MNSHLDFNNHIDAILTFVYSCLPIIFSLLSLYGAFSFLKKARALENTPTSKIRSAAQGYLELSGRSAALPNHPLVAKLTQTPCVWYCYTIEELTHRQNIKDNREAYWNIIAEEISVTPFMLIDETGESVILPEKADIIPNAITTWRGHSRTPSPPPTSFWTSFFWNSWGSFRYTERRLELNTPLYTIGQFYTWQADSTELKNYPVLEHYVAQNNLKTLHVIVQTLLRPNEPFIISGIAEKLLIRRLKRKSALFFVGFLLFVSITAYSNLPLVKQNLKNWAFKIQKFHH